MALGRKRAVFPDDMPTLSALPWEEREKILSSMGNDGECGSWVPTEPMFVGCMEGESAKRLRAPIAVPLQQG